jgi:hypothetical protein
LLDLEVVDLGLDQKRYLDLTDLQIAAAGWLAQHAMFHRIFELYPDRVRSLDSEVFLSRPEEALSALAGLFGLSLDAAAVAAGPGFKRHSKFDSSFSPEDRAADQRDAATLHADEIDKVAVWAEAVAANAGISMTLPAPLLGRTPASPLDRRRNLEQ